MDDSLRILIVDEDTEHQSRLERTLAACGHRVLARLSPRDDLRARIPELAPDLIIVDVPASDRELLDEMQRVHADSPRPIVMFVKESDRDSIRAAVRAGVSAYVVGGLGARSVEPVVEVALARFQEVQLLRGELASTRERLEERKWIERAKGILIARRGVSEDEAFRLLRRSAMDRNTKLVEVARQLVSLEDLL